MDSLEQAFNRVAESFAVSETNTAALNLELNSIQGATSSFDQRLKSAAMSSKAIADNLQRAADSMSRTQPPTSRMFGGPMYLAGGGSARGVDTIPAMLSPGEFVVNSRSSSRFFSQLQAINAGQTPVFRESGGSIDNSTNVGDIHIHSAKQPQQTAEAVISAINRAQRRGTGRIR